MYSLKSIPFAMDPTLLWLRPEVIVLCLTLTAILYRWLSSSRPPLPPGPKGYPIFGNTLPKALCVLQVLSIGVGYLLTPLISAYRHFEKWTQEYGPVFSLKQGLTTTIVVGRWQAAVDILEREGAATADRPRSIAAGETLSGGMRVLFTPAGERFKKMRR